MSRKSPLFLDVGQGLSIMVGMPTITYWTTSSRPKKPSKGTFGFNSDTNSLEIWSGSAWLSASLKALSN
jgi:hypothetical protein